MIKKPTATYIGRDRGNGKLIPRPVKWNLARYPDEGKKRTSKAFHQFSDGDIRLLQNGLQRFRFDLPVHRHAGMQAVFLVMTMRTSLPEKSKTQAFQCAAHLIARKVAGEFHAT
jgi:hypothetical protein